MSGTALIVGGGVGGMSAAIALRRAGMAVELIDADPHWRVYGAGISLTGISLRAFDDLGVLGAVRQRGFVGCGMRGRARNGATMFESLILDNPLPVQQSGGILRPALHDILASVVRREAVKITLGVRVTGLSQVADGVDVAFDDGRRGRYDLVVGADGIHSQIRGMIFPDAPAPRFTGQGCWRVVAKRPSEVDRLEMYFGGPVKLGINPVSEQEMYVFVLEHVPDNPFFEKEALVPHLTGLIAAFDGAVPAVRDSIKEPAQVNYRPLEWILLPAPWHVGRVVLIGDAVHATTPHLASGAGLAAEDGLVLAQEIERRGSLDAALRAFTERRFERVRRVVETSVHIGELEIAGDPANRTTMMAGETLASLQAPY